MKLHVKNFGPIREADVELKPLTVFVGPSNTGKSYLAMLLYSLAKTLGNEHDRILWAVQRPFNALFREAPPDPNEWLATVNDSSKIVPVIDQAISAFADAIRRTWIDEARRCFGPEWDVVANQNGNSPLSMSFDYYSFALGLFDAQKDKLPGAQELAPLLKREAARIVEDVFQRPGNSGLRQSRRFAGICGAIIFNCLHSSRNALEPVINDVHYLPATRGGIMHSHRDLAGVIIRDAAAPEVDTGRLNGVMADFLNKLLDIGDGAMREKRSFQNVADISRSSRKIENEILDGQIEVQISETGYPFFRYRFGGKDSGKRDVPLLSASTSVSELAPVVLFMRYYLSQNSVFIVEEPEAHLHPAAQRKIASVLAGLVKSGVHVVVTTHSDMILEQLSNFVHAHGYPETNLLNEKSGERTVSEDQTAVYSFVDSRRGEKTIVRKIDFDEDTGMLTRDHLDESSDLYNETVDIFNTKKEQAANDN